MGWGEGELQVVRRVAVPRQILALGLLDRVDYGDAFAGSCEPRVLARFTSQELGELAMGRAPRWLRTLVRVAQGRVLGLDLDRSTLDSSLGWKLLSSCADVAVYGAPGRLATTRLAVVKEPAQALVVFLFRQEQPWATPVLALVKPIHRTIVRYLLTRCLRLAREDANRAGR